EPAAEEEAPPLRRRRVRSFSAPEPEPAPAAEAPAAEPEPPAEEPEPAPAPAAPPAPAAAAPLERPRETPREANEKLVRALLSARLEDDQDALARLLAEDIALILPGEEPIVGRRNLLGTWDRQAELLDEADAFETDVRALAGSDDHVFTYMETRAEAGDNAVTYTTMTAYRIRSGQITEVRYHVDDVLGYLAFWRALAQGAGSGPAPELEPEPEVESEVEVEVEPEVEVEVEPEPAPEPPRRKLGFARFR
ncbi:MAG: hypothetical protein QOG36_2109, partial [Actinomycetota bacterium]|nr:hypothetical protein [Actinomycetota bacterium]